MLFYCQQTPDITLIASDFYKRICQQTNIYGHLSDVYKCRTFCKIDGHLTIINMVDIYKHLWSPSDIWLTFTNISGYHYITSSTFTNTLQPKVIFTIIVDIYKHLWPPSTYRRHLLETYTGGFGHIGARKCAYANVVGYIPAGESCQLNKKM